MQRDNSNNHPGRKRAVLERRQAQEPEPAPVLTNRPPPRRRITPSMRRVLDAASDLAEAVTHLTADEATRLEEETGVDPVRLRLTAERMCEPA